MQYIRVHVKAFNNMSELLSKGSGTALSAKDKVHR